VVILHLVAQRSTVFKRGLVAGGVSIVLDIALVDYVGGELRILLVDGCRSTQAVHRSSSRAWLLRVMVVSVIAYLMVSVLMVISVIANVMSMFFETFTYMA
jgi:hypothetical protein